jgi:hypothetical protein
MAFADSAILASNATFQGRVGAALFTYLATVVNTEAWTVPFHRERQTFCSQVLARTDIPNPWIATFANSVSCDTTVVSDATQAGTVPLTGANVATQQALVTDTHISNAVASQLNSYIREPAN